jgi:CDP-diacylglycerol--glycerol-3-phosphate 3-phosphatidyltransferase
MKAPDGIWNLPNRITFGRLGLSVALFAILGAMQEDLVPWNGAWGWAAFLLFAIAAATDWLDGYLDRRYGLVTALGRIMDPFVDKVVVCGTFIFLCAPTPTLFPTTITWIAPWMVVVIVGREFLVSALRGFMESRGVNFQADMPGKVKMFLQCLAIGGVLLFRCLPVTEDHVTAGPAWAVDALEFLIPTLLWLTLASTIYSGWYYIRKALVDLARLES